MHCPTALRTIRDSLVVATAMLVIAGATQRV